MLRSKEISHPRGAVKLSFCITHKNREHFIQQTLLTNLKDNMADQGWIEFVVMDFNENAKLQHWIEKEFIEHIKSGYLKYFRAEGLKEWHASIAKNTSHKVASGAVLVNLDCDNYTGLQGARFVWHHFEQYKKEIVLWQFSRVKQDGSFGRIAITREMFNNIGGYNEDLMPMGYQDNDLFERARASGAKLIHKKDKIYNGAIPNEKYMPKNMKYEKMRDDNKRTSRRNIKDGNLKANNGNMGLKKISKMNENGQMLPF